MGDSFTAHSRREPLVARSRHHTAHPFYHGLSGVKRKARRVVRYIALGMPTRRDNDRALVIVRDLIHEWDPYGLLGGGAPTDEWDREIGSVVAQIPRIRSHADAAHAVSRVFSSAFQPEGFSPGDCADVGKRLYTALADAGLLGD